MGIEQPSMAKVSIWRDAHLATVRVVVVKGDRIFVLVIFRLLLTVHKNTLEHKPFRVNYNAHCIIKA
jgi:hypothetical protein